MISIRQASHRYPSGKGVTDLSFDVLPGVHGILGPNGAGKTTMLRMIMQLLAPDSGSILVDGLDIWSDEAIPRYRRNIGFVPTDDYFIPYLTGRQNLEYLSKLRTGRQDAYLEIGEELERFGVGEFWDESFSSYSTGMRKRIQLPAALIGDPAILIFDEPNDGMDILANIELKTLVERLAARGKTVLISSHMLEFLEGLVDGLTILAEGRIVFNAKPFTGSVRETFLSAIGYSKGK